MLLTFFSRCRFSRFVAPGGRAAWLVKAIKSPGVDTRHETRDRIQETQDMRHETRDNFRSFLTFLTFSREVPGVFRDHQGPSKSPPGPFPGTFPELFLTILECVQGHF